MLLIIEEKYLLCRLKEMKSEEVFLYFLWILLVFSHLNPNPRPNPNPNPNSIPKCNCITLCKRWVFSNLCSTSGKYVWGTVVKNPVEETRKLVTYIMLTQRKSFFGLRISLISSGDSGNENIKREEFLRISFLSHEAAEWYVKEYLRALQKKEICL